MSWFLQTAVVTALNFRTIGQRLGSSAVTIFGVAGVVAVFVAVLSIAEGFKKTLEATGRPDTALVLRSGSPDEMSSGLTRESTRIVADAEGVARADGQPTASAELFVIVDLPKITTGTPANVPLRGIQPAAFEVRPWVRIVEGRTFEWGKNEIIAGKAASGQFAGLTVGSTHTWSGTTWTVVGIFEAGGSVSESELWCDVGVLQPAYRRGTTFQSIHARLESEAMFDRFKDALTTDPRLDVKVVRQDEFYAEQSRFLTDLVNGLGMLVAALMAVGAVFGALITMYTAVAARTREIATLRALGFGGGAVVISVLTEALLLGLIGGVIGGTIAYVGFNGYQASTINWQTFSQVAFAFAVTPALFVRGVVYALLIGLIGGLFPAIRAIRMPVASALRAL